MADDDGEVDVRGGGRRRVAGLALCVVVLAACGQKPGVHVTAAAPARAPAGGGVATPGTLPATDAAGDAGDAPSAVAAPAPTTTQGAVAAPAPNPGTAEPGGSAVAGATPQQAPATEPPADEGSSAPQASAGEAAAPQQATRQGGRTAPRGSDRTGVTADSITIGLHAPVTGAAPLPSTSFQDLRDLYWKWRLDEQGGNVLGRKRVNVLFQDDKYDPNSATQVCRQLASQSFLVAAGGGTDQIQACGKLANVQKFPYFSPGVTEAGLQGNPWYFAASMTYRAQGLLLAQYIKKTHGDKPVAAVVTQTSNFDDAVQGFQQGAQQVGLNLVDVKRHPKGDTSWYGSFVTDLKGKAEVVYVLSSPVDYIRFANKAAENSWSPAWVGVGISKGLNAVLANGCPALEGGVFFSPFPGLDYARQNIPEYFAAASKRGLAPDDLGLALWGLAEVESVTFQRYAETFGNDLTREDYRALVETLAVQTKTFPAIQWAPNNHFGGRQVHVLRADCASKTHKTVATFVSGF